MQTYAVNWPIGMGERFKACSIAAIASSTCLSAPPTAAAPPPYGDGYGRPRIEALLDQDLYYQFKEELEMIEELGPELDLRSVHAGQMTPVFFGSAMTNFGVQLFLDAFLDYALKPHPARQHPAGEVPPTDEEFSGFVFKLQANMDPKHRDRVAFVRVCSGKFEKDMVVTHARSGKSRCGCRTPKSCLARAANRSRRPSPGM
jgi:peptide chain release factor 3